jgi:hypothetical protein
LRPEDGEIRERNPEQEALLRAAKPGLSGGGLKIRFLELASRWKPAACNDASRVSASSYSSFKSLALALFTAKIIANNASEYRSILKSKASGVPGYNYI